MAPDGGDLAKIFMKINIARFLSIWLRTVEKRYQILKCELSRPRCLLKLGCIPVLGYKVQVSKEDEILAHHPA